MADTTDTPRPKRAYHRKTPVKTAPVAEAAPKRKPHIDILKRRLQNPFGAPSAGVELKEAGYVTRWVNGDLWADRVWQVKQMGWEDVTFGELAAPEQIGGYETEGPTQVVCRGQRKQERLMKMPQAAFDQIQKAKAASNIRTYGNPSAQRAEIAQAAASALGPEAADFLGEKTRMVGSVGDSKERIERFEEP